MSNIINRVTFDWRFESSGDPFFKVGSNGLEVSFLIVKREDERENEIKSLLKENKFKFDSKVLELDMIYDSIFLYLDKLGLQNRIDDLDFIYNNGGMGRVYFKFEIFDHLFYGSEETVKKKYKNFASVFNNKRGLYEEVNALGERKYYLFIGYDTSLVIKTSKEFSYFHIEKLSI